MGRPRRRTGRKDRGRLIRCIKTPCFVGGFTGDFDPDDDDDADSYISGGIVSAEEDDDDEEPERFQPITFPSSSTFIRDSKALLKRHQFDLSAPELLFLGISRGQQKVIHQVASAMRLIHFTRNFGPNNRALFITDRSCFTDDYGIAHDAIFVRAYAALEGNALEQHLQQLHVNVPKAWSKARASRDGSHLHHMTLFTKQEILSLMSTYEWEQDVGDEECFTEACDHVLSVCAEVAKEHPFNLWEDRGLGQVFHNGNTAVFRIVLWPFGDRVRSELGFECTNFHITLGFFPNDVHSGPPKDESSWTSCIHR